MTFEIRRCIAPPSRAKRKSRTARLAALIAIRQDETHVVDRWNAAEPASRCFAGLACRIRAGSLKPESPHIRLPQTRKPRPHHAAGAFFCIGSFGTRRRCPCSIFDVRRAPCRFFVNICIAY
ncbi:hypothetical protein X948_4075 [Burkholderia pseudomallei MSHR5608]|nr:hypothetical protein X948_4075 [Burkholderia pseudomallei MSHR5608]